MISIYIKELKIHEVAKTSRFEDFTGTDGFGYQNSFRTNQSVTRSGKQLTVTLKQIHKTWTP